MPGTKQKSIPVVTLAEFARAKRRTIARVACKVCALPAPVRAELRAAMLGKIAVDLQLEWLKTEHRVTLTRAHLTVHRNGHHDE